MELRFSIRSINMEAIGYFDGTILVEWWTEGLIGRDKSIVVLFEEFCCKEKEESS